jgi:hypothetical protein
MESENLLRKSVIAPEELFFPNRILQLLKMQFFVIFNRPWQRNLPLEKMLFLS